MFPLQYEPGHAAVMWLDAKLDPTTGRRYETGYNQVFVDPVSAEIIGKREWGKTSLDQEHLMSFLYKLHFSLQIPELGGTDRWGVWLMGVVALSWLANTLVGCCLTLPAGWFRMGGAGKGGPPDPGKPPSASRWRLWKQAWQVKWRAGAFRVQFDLHRAGGLWFLSLLLILAFTSVSLNLYREVFYPVMSMVSEVTPGPFDLRKPTPLHQPVEPRVSWAQAVERMQQEGALRGWSEPAGDIYYSDNYGIYGARFFQPGTEHGMGGMGAKTLYFDGADGRILGEVIPWQGTGADIFVQMQSPLHSGRILGLPGRIMISVMGLVIAMLSATGLLIWLKKKRARTGSQKK